MASMVAPVKDELLILADRFENVFRKLNEDYPSLAESFIDVESDLYQGDTGVGAAEAERSVALRRVREREGSHSPRAETSS